MRIYSAILALFLLVSPSLAASPVPASGIISTSGEYYLAADRTTASSPVISITANNVVLDLKRRTVRCNPASPTTATNIGVIISGGNVTVRDGKITGCFMGGHATGSTGNVSWERVNFTGNTYIGVNGGTAFVGNIFDDITGYTTEAYAIGINAPANGCYVFGNTFRNMHRQPGAASGKVGEGVGVLISSGTTGCTVEANWFENDVLGLERDIGVWVAASAQATIHDNSFTNIGWTVAASGTATVTDNRFWMRDAETDSVAVAAGVSSSVTAEDNVIIGYEDGFSGPITESDNLILP